MTEPQKTAESSNSQQPQHVHFKLLSVHFDGLTSPPSLGTAEQMAALAAASPDKADQGSLDSSSDNQSTVTSRKSVGHVHSHGPLCHHGPRPIFRPGQTIRGYAKVEVTASPQTPSGTHLPHFHFPHINLHLSSGHHHHHQHHHDGQHSEVSDTSAHQDESDKQGHDHPNHPNAISVRLEGYGKTQWRVAGENGGKAQMRDSFANETKYVHVTPDLPPGQHDLPFEFELPNDVPPSFEGKHGFIRYRLRAKTGHLAGDIKLPFNVVFAEHVDDEALMKPCEDTRSRNIHFWCVSRGSRSVHAKVDRTCYHYQGDVAYINARFSNECRNAAKPVAKLIQQQTFYGRGLISKTFKKSVQAWLLAPAADLSPLQPDEDRLWVNVECTLPMTTPSFHSSLIDIDYYIEIELADTSASLTSKAAAKMLMASSATHNAVASIWVLMADGSFQKKPGIGQAAPQAITLIPNTSKSSLISDTSSDISVPISPTATTAPPLTAGTDDSPKHNKNLAPGKQMPYIREDSKEDYASSEK